MAKIKHAQVTAHLAVLLELDESEVRALDGIFGYNVDAFLKVFYERMGRAYVEQHERGVRSLHKTIRGVLSDPLSKMDNARAAMRDSLKPI